MLATRVNPEGRERKMAEELKSVVAYLPVEATRETASIQFSRAHGEIGGSGGAVFGQSMKLPSTGEGKFEKGAKFFLPLLDYDPEHFPRR